MRETEHFFYFLEKMFENKLNFLSCVYLKKFTIWSDSSPWNDIEEDSTSTLRHIYHCFQRFSFLVLKNSLNYAFWESSALLFENLNINLFQQDLKRIVRYNARDSALYREICKFHSLCCTVRHSLCTGLTHCKTTNT